MANKRINALSIGFNEADTQTMRETLNGKNGVYLVAAADDGQDAIEKFKQFIPDMVIINIINDTDGKIGIIKEIRSITDDQYHPFFISAHLTDEADTRKNLYHVQLPKMGHFFPRYGQGQDITTVITFAHRVAPFVRDKSERKAKGVVWKCETW